LGARRVQAAGIDKETQGSVHSAFYNGYTLSQARRRRRAGAARRGARSRCRTLTLSLPPRAAAQIPGGWAASRYGGERVLSVSFLLWSAASLLTPSDGSRTGSLYVARVLVGAAMGVVFPSIHSILVTWIPPHERSRAVSLFTSGMYFGSAFGMLTLPLLIAARGPGAVPLAVGALGFAWLALWSRFANKRPGAPPQRRVFARRCRVRGVRQLTRARARSSLLPAGASQRNRPDVPWVRAPACPARCVFCRISSHRLFALLRRRCCCAACRSGRW
jgi:hypothetical protein